ncbi:hypothetical protein LCGC14_2966300, partial [marine sediment metagenome]
ETERQTLLYDFNDTDVDYPQDKTLPQLFEAQVEKAPNHIALVFEDEQLSYAELNRRANQLARVIREQYQQKQGKPLAPDTLIALYLDRSLEMVISILAVLKAGGAYVPIATEYPQERTLFMLADTEAAIVITQQQYIDRWDDWLQGSATQPALIVADDAYPIDQPSIDNLLSISGPTDLAYVIYTSGTTGKPKGVTVEHRGVASLINNQTNHFQFTSDERVLCLSSYYFDASIEQIFLGLSNGAQLILPASSVIKDATQIKQYIYELCITHLNATPSYLIALGSIKDFNHIKRVVSGGENCQAKLLEIWGNLLINEYGPTESTITAVQCVNFSQKKSSNIIGSPVGNTKVYVLSVNYTQLPIGATGELYIGG